MGSSLIDELGEWRDKAVRIWVIGREPPMVGTLRAAKTDFVVLGVKVEDGEVPYMIPVASIRFFAPSAARAE